MDLEFHDAPPPAKRGPGASMHKPFLDALKANPGKWAKCPERAKVGHVKHWKTKGFDAVARNRTKDNKADLWAMWPGDGEVTL